MLIVTVEVVLEDDINADLRPAFRMLDEESAKEAGCLKHVSSIDMNDPRIINILGLWESMEALMPHSQTAHMTSIQRAFSEQKIESIESKVYDIRGELPFPNG